MPPVIVDREAIAAPPSSKDEFPIHPVAGIIAVAVTVVAASSAVPDDPAPIGAMFQTGLLMTLGLAAVPTIAAFGSFKTLLRGEHLLVLAPIYWLLLDLIQSAYGLAGVTSDIAKDALIAIACFVVGVWLAALMRPWRVPNTLMRAATFEINANALFAIVLTSFAIGIFKYAEPCGFDPSEMIYNLGNARFSAPWNRGVLGNWSSFQDAMKYFGYLLPAFAVLMSTKVGWSDPRTIVSLALSLIMAIFLAQEGGRRNVGAIFGMAVILWILTRPRMGVWGLTVVAIAAAMLLYLMQTMLEYRGVGFGALFDSEVEIAKRDYIHVDDNYLRLCQSIELVPSTYPHTYLQYFFYIAIRPIPRVLWPGKPIDSGFDLAESVNVSGTSLSNSVVGELYVSGGLVMVLFGGWLYGRLAGMATGLLDQDRRSGGYVAYSIFMMALFAGVRSMLDLVLISYVVLAWMAICWIFHGLRRRNTSATPAQV